MMKQRRRCIMHRRLGSYIQNALCISSTLDADDGTIIIPQELFDRVQERLALTKKAPAKNKAEDEYLLTTKLICGECERMMVGESGTSHNGETYRYYKCIGVKKHLGCTKKSVKKDWIEGLVLTHIRQVIFDDAFIEKLADRIMEDWASKTLYCSCFFTRLSCMTRAMSMTVFLSSSANSLHSLLKAM